MTESRGSRTSEMPGSSPSPYVSVIVTAHDRTEYLRGAVESVLAQTLAPDDYEILVVKFVRDAGLDAWLAGQAPRVRTVTDESLPRLGQKLAFGIGAARGEVVCFLEDDDRYLPEKLATVAARFRRDPDLLYFRNRNRCIDGLGRVLIGPYARTSPDELRIVGAARDDLATVDFIRHYGAEGNSAIALRRATILPYVDRLAEFSTSTDWILFAAALSRAGTLVVGTQVLSEYRLHDSLSQSSSQASRQRLSREIVRSGEALIAIAGGTRAERAARFLRGRGAVVWYLMDPDAPRPSASTFLDAAWPAWLRREPTFAIQLGWCAPRLIAPRSTANAFWGYRQRDASRQRWHTETDRPSVERPSLPGGPPT